MNTRTVAAGVLALFALFATPVRAQGTRADYERAARLGESARLVKRFAPAWRWLPEGRGVGFELERDGGAKEFVAIDAATGARAVAATPEALGLGTAFAPAAIAPASRRTSSRHGGGETTITFENKFDRPVRLFWVDPDGRPRAYGEVPPGGSREQHTYAGHAWIADFAKDDLAGVFVAEAGSGIAVIDESSRRAASESPEAAPSPARTTRTFVKDSNVWMTGPDGVEHKLSTSGTEADPYENPEYPSPDGTLVLGFQTVPAQRREVVLVESAPRDEVQPRVLRHDYLKPGDAIARPRPRLFDLARRAEIPIDDAPFENAWSIDRVRWSPDGKTVYCLYNRRGHQKLALYAIDAATGAVRTVVEETSPTFVDYSQKTWLEWLPPNEEFLWTSERDGWNHLYLVDAKTGATRQLTRGEWMVRRVERVDPEKREIWFAAFGIRPGQDPYHAHLARIGFDGSGLVVLTEGDGTHEWTFSPDGALFVDRWSRVDHPPVTELRRARDGSLVAELGRDDASPLLATGFRPPERFVAKGRDGKTDIHGIIVRPSHFDPAKKYPVIEDIYAGPHGHFVPKSFGLGLRQRTLAELGFIVVQIDGMGTNWRGKAFHDVCWRNLKDSGFPDRIAWLRAAAAARPEMDLSRGVGIFGGSAGGQSALAALLHHGDFYKVAVADCGCHDNRMDKIWWNEAWMGWPIGPWYADNSNVTHAGKLTGKLLLTVGELDRNVDPASTLQVVNALVAADKDFDFLLVPGAGHGVGESAYASRKRMDFFVRHLLGVEPPPRD